MSTLSRSPVAREFPGRLAARRRESIGAPAHSAPGSPAHASPPRRAPRVLGSGPLQTRGTLLDAGRVRRSRRLTTSDGLIRAGRGRGGVMKERDVSPPGNSIRLDLLDEDAEVALVVRAQADHAESQALALRLVQLHADERDEKGALVRKESRRRAREQRDRERESIGGARSSDSRHSKSESGSMRRGERHVRARYRNVLISFPPGFFPAANKIKSSPLDSLLHPYCCTTAESALCQCQPRCANRLGPTAR